MSNGEPGKGGDDVVDYVSKSGKEWKLREGETMQELKHRAGDNPGNETPKAPVAPKSEGTRKVDGGYFASHYGPSHMGLAAMPTATWDKATGKWFTKTQQSFSTVSFTHHLGIQPVYYCCDPNVLDTEFTQRAVEWQRVLNIRTNINFASADVMRASLAHLRTLLPQFKVPADTYCLMFVQNVYGLPGRYRNDGMIDDNMQATGRNMRRGVYDLQAIAWHEMKYCLPQEVRNWIELWLHELIVALRTQDMPALLALGDLIEQHYTYSGSDSVIKDMTSPEARAVIAIRLINQWLQANGRFRARRTRCFDEATNSQRGVSSRLSFYEDTNTLYTGLAAFLESQFPRQLDALGTWAQTLNTVESIDIALQRVDLIMMLCEYLALERHSMLPGQMLRFSSAQGETMWDATARLNIIQVRHGSYNTTFHGRTFSGYLPYQWRPRASYLRETRGRMTEETLANMLYSSAPIDDAVRMVYSQYYDGINNTIIMMAKRAFATTSSRTIISIPFPGPDGTARETLVLTKAVINPMITVEDIHLLQHKVWPTKVPATDVIAHGPGVWFDFAEAIQFGAETQTVPTIGNFFPVRVW